MPLSYTDGLSFGIGLQWQPEIGSGGLGIESNIVPDATMADESGTTMITEGSVTMVTE